ncbi:NEDD4-like E3 ubiquitin-protein ligase WWP1 [Symbiodinium microadriaticum]|uniref:NEDD4-like E3 ubiquitin-protein ligase WWP1 n=1 Tax=Symbiodinium microadriaticum TaxID=2951 RepID=A0A1Q9CG47_SYMMI|nr:NEDD4-like E3 ubiquitin-protein ligase WWP1 [Symbiodinium microadriaticum]
MLSCLHVCSSARSISQLKRRSLRSLSDPVHPSILFGSLVDELGGAETEMADVLPDGWGAYQDDQGRTYYANISTGETSWEPPAPALALPEGWTAHQDEQGRTFYANCTTGESSWDPPAPAPAAPAPPAAPVPTPAPAGRWSVDFTYTIGPEGSEHVFSGKVQLLDRSVYTSVGSVVESLNRGSPAVPEGYCVVFSNSKRNYFLLWREDKEAEAFALLGIGTDSGDQWSTSQVLRLDPSWTEEFFAGRCAVVDKARYDSVTAAVDALNAGIVIEGQQGYCAVWSTSQQCFHLVWRQDKEQEAYAALGVR